MTTDFLRALIWPVNQALIYNLPSPPWRLESSHPQLCLKTYLGRPPECDFHCQRTTSSHVVTCVTKKLVLAPRQEKPSESGFQAHLLWQWNLELELRLLEQPGIAALGTLTGTVGWTMQMSGMHSMSKVKEPTPTFVRTLCSPARGLAAVLYKRRHPYKERCHMASQAGRNHSEPRCTEVWSWESRNARAGTEPTSCRTMYQSEHILRLH